MEDFDVLVRENQGRSGIYGIKCLENDRVYVGQAVDIGKRVAGHYTQLKYNKHDNSKIQTDFNKFGFDRFEFVVLEYVHHDMLAEREDFWLQKETNLYNFNFYASLPELTPEQFKTFWVRIKKTDGCWLWIGGKDKDGYGRIGFRGKDRRKLMYYAHRLSYFLFMDKDPRHSLVCHKCDNPSCVNPKHLFLGSFSDNALDRCDKGRHNGQKITRETANQIRQLYLINQNLTRVDFTKLVNEKFSSDLSHQYIVSILLNKTWIDPNWQIKSVGRTVRTSLNWGIVRCIHYLKGLGFDHKSISFKIYAIFTRNIKVAEIKRICSGERWNMNSKINKLDLMFDKNGMV